MNSLLYLLALLTLASSCRWENDKKVCRWKRPHHRRWRGHHIDPESDIENVQNKFFESEIGLQVFCNLNNNVVTKEKYDDDVYTIKYELDDSENLDIKVTIFHRLMYTVVKKIDTNTLIFKDLKVLPGIVQPEKAKWKVENKKLRISIPYKVPLGQEATSICEAISTEVIDVQEAEDVSVYINARIAEETTDFPTTVSWDDFYNIIFRDEQV